MTEVHDNSRVDNLVAELGRYRARYQDVTLPPEVDRLRLAMGKRRTRVELLRTQLTELVDEIARVEAEIAGCSKGYEALLSDTIERIKYEHHEGWSPFPVLGYRIWGWRAGALHGAREVWQTPSKTARCASGSTDDLPHSDSRCGRLGCGVYATKTLDSIVEGHTEPTWSGYFAGLVELTGKVVEHEHGYRASNATVTAGVLVSHDRIFETDRPDRLGDVFDNPDNTMRQFGVLQAAAGRTDAIVGFLTTNERSIPWISGNRNA